MNLNKKSFLLMVIFLIIKWAYPAAAEDNFSPPLQYFKNPSIKIGFFYGGRVNAIYRAFVEGYFDKEGIKVELLTRLEDKNGWFSMPQSYEATREILDAGNPLVFGRATGTEIIENMEKGVFVGGTIGESSFIYACARGSPIQAVALLGHDSAERPGKCLVVRNGVTIKNPQDFKGKRIVSRRAGPGDVIYVKEFVSSIGLDPEKDVIIIEQVPSGKLNEYLETGKADAVLYHMYAVPPVEKAGIGYIYCPMNWMNPELAQAVLVFREDFIKTHPDLVEKFILGYMKRLKFEKKITVTDEERLLHTDDLGTKIKYHYKNLSMPVYDYPPLVRLDLLTEMQQLLFKYKEIDKQIDLGKYINNDFVTKAYEELK
jgi:ABC-type nitrate/sulfonate/bicarbonate transport system substrate-binding protein